MKPIRQSPRTTRRERGIGLVEILVGVVVGLIGVVIIFQVLAIAEARKRNSTSASDAQVSGALGLYTLDRDVRLAGYGFGTAAENQMGCEVVGLDAQGTPPALAFTLSPVVITQGTNVPDTIAVLYGSSNLFVATRAFSTSTTTTKFMESGGRAGFLRGDVIIAAPPAATAGVNCVVLEVTDNTNPDNLTLTHAQGAYISDYGPNGTPLGATARYNSGSTAVTGTGGFAYNLGPNPRLNVWSIVNNRLQVLDTLHSNRGATQVADNVIDMQAEYGIDTNADNLIGNGEWTTVTPTTNVGWRNVRAMRVALLARSAQWDPAHCSATPQWTSGASGELALANFVMTDLDGGPGTPCNPGDDLTDAPRNPNNWRNYRYRVYETVIPLRNMIWGTAP